MTLRQKQQERWRANTAAYRKRHGERLRAERAEKYDPEKQRAYAKRYQDKHPERVASLTAARRQRSYPKMLAYARERGRERSKLLADMKLARGCADCGYNTHAEALEFDHLHDKEAEIASLRTCSMDRLLKEIDKCEVVCANCHRVRTASRRSMAS